MPLQLNVTWNPAAGDPTPGVEPTAPPEAQWTTTSTFDANLAALTSGGTLWLAPGNYGSKTINNRAFTSQTTIRSARLDNLAEFRASGGSGSTPALSCDGTNNLRMKDIRFTMPSDSGTQKWYSTVFFGTGTNVTVSGCVFYGKDPDGYGRGGAITFAHCTNSTIENCTMSYLHGAWYFSACNTFTVTGCHIHHIAEDFGGVLSCADGVIRENLFEVPWRPPSSTYDYHPDITQFLGHTSENGPNRRMVIWRNRVFTGGGHWCAGFALNTMNTGSYTDFLFQENLIFTSHVEALQVKGDRMTIRKNTVLFDPVYLTSVGSPNGAPGAGISTYGGTDLVVTDNLAGSVPNAGAGVTLSNNRILDDADYPTWLVGPYSGTMSQAALAAKPGNAIYTSVQGAQFTRPLDPVPTFPTLPWAAAPAFPAVASRSSGNVTTASTSHPIPMPAGYAVGDAVVVYLSSNGVVTTTASGTGWAKLYEATNGSAASFSVWAKIITGSETLTITTSAGTTSAFITHRISGAHATDAFHIAGVTGTSTNADPPNLGPVPGSQDYLWIAATGWDGVITPSAAPTGFTDLTTSLGPGTSVATAERTETGASLNPGAFTSATEEWLSVTLAIRSSGVVAGAFAPAWQQFTTTSWLSKATDLTGIPTNAAGVTFAATWRPDAVDTGATRTLFGAASGTSRLMFAYKDSANLMRTESENNANAVTWGKFSTATLSAGTRYLILWGVDPAVGWKQVLINLGTGAVVESTSGAATGTMGGPSASGWAINSQGTGGTNASGGQYERVQMWTSYADVSTGTVQGYFHASGALKDPAVAIAALGTPIVSIVGSALQTGGNAGSGGNFVKDGVGTITAV